MFAGVQGQGAAARSQAVWAELRGMQTAGGTRRSLTGHLQGREGEAGGEQDGQVSGLGHWVDGGVSCGRDEGYGTWEIRGRFLLSLF